VKMPPNFDVRDLHLKCKSFKSSQLSALVYMYMYVRASAHTHTNTKEPLILLRHS